MSIFEFIMVMVSLILALALAQALRGATELVTSTKRYWVHAVWLFSIILLILFTWWSYWDWNVVSEWRLTTYLGALIFPMILFTTVYLLVPATRTVDTDWQAHFFSIRVWFLSLMMIMIACAIAYNILIFETPFFHPYRIFHVGLLLIYLTGLLSQSPKIHGVLSIANLVIFVASQIAIRMEAGALIRS